MAHGDFGFDKVKDNIVCLEHYFHLLSKVLTYSGVLLLILKLFHQLLKWGFDIFQGDLPEIGIVHIDLRLFLLSNLKFGFCKVALLGLIVDCLTVFLDNFRCLRNCKLVD